MLKVAADVIFQYADQSVTSADLVKKARATWASLTGNAESEVYSMDLYVKPEDGKAYYVVNGKDFGDVALEG